MQSEIIMRKALCLISLSVIATGLVSSINYNNKRNVFLEDYLSKQTSSTSVIQAEEYMNSQFDNNYNSTVCYGAGMLGLMVGGIDELINKRKKKGSKNE
jgi:Na+-translocating ferredoxin:NAD+ oxidoreductase RnfG subunit